MANSTLQFIDMILLHYFRLLAGCKRSPKVDRIHMQNILVVGGAGYIGSHVCKALAAAGYRPIVYDNLSRGHEWSVKWGPLVRGDIADKIAIRKLLDEYRPAAVMHFAAFAYVGESNDHPLMYYGQLLRHRLSSARCHGTFQDPNRFFFELRDLWHSGEFADHGKPSSGPG